MAIVHTVTQQDLDDWNLQGGTLYINDVLAVVGSTISNGDTLKAIANSGRQFDTENTLGNQPQPRYSYRRSTNTSSSSQFTTTDGINYTNTVASAAVSLNYIRLYTIEAEVTAPVIAYTFTQSDINTLTANNAYITVNGVTAITGTEVEDNGEIVLNPNSGYILDLANCYFSGFDDYSYQDNFFFSGNNESASLTMYDSYSYDSLSISTNEEQPPEPTPDFIYTESLQSTVTENKCALFCNGALLAVNAGFNNGDVLELIPNSGYELISAIIISYDENNYSDEQIFVDGVLTLNIPSGYDISSFNISTSQIDIVAGGNNLFKITKADLQQISIDRFQTVGTSPPTIIDYGDNILGVINLPFDIDPTYIQEPELIRLGTHDTTVTAPKISIDKLYLNLGSINVPMPENSLGFTNARVLIHLPYANSLALDINEVLGQIINVEYVIDLYNGNSYINIKSNKSDSIIATNNVDLGVAIPYSSLQGNNDTVYNSNMSLGGDNHVKTPYIEIIQNIPILGNGFFTSPITAESTLNSEQGFVQVEEIKLNVTATSSEKDMILTALKNGVIIQ